MEPITAIQELNDNHLKIYGMLVDRIQKHSTILWQFPVALVLGNAVALDELLRWPWALLVLGFADLAFAYALAFRGSEPRHRRSQQDC